MQASPDRNLANPLPVKRGWNFPKIFVDLTALAIFPLLLAFLNDYWAFTSSQQGFIDPWLYVSYFLHLKAQLHAFPTAYYGDRLSYNLIGWLLYHVFGPFAGNYILRLLTIYAALGSLYASTALLFGRRTALIAGLLASVQPYFLIAFGWSYVDGAGIAYYGLSLYFFLRAAYCERPAPWLIGAGAFLTCLITSHLLWLNVAWTLPLAFYLVNRRQARHRLPESLAQIFFGALIAALAFSAIYHYLTGSWIFVRNSINHTLGGFGAAQRVNHPVSTWVGVANWLDQYNAVLLLSIFWLFRKNATYLEKVAVGLFLVSYATIWAWELAGFPFTMLLFYSDFIFPVFFLACAALLYRPLQSISVRSYAIIASAVLVLGGAMVFSAGEFDRPLETVTAYFGKHPATQPLWSFQAVYLSAALALAVLILGMGKSLRRGYVIAFIAVFLFLCGSDLLLMMRQGWLSGRGAYSNKQAYQAIIDADKWANGLKDNRRLLCWYDRNDPQVSVIAGLTSLYLWGWSLLNDQLPVISRDSDALIQARPDILVVSSKPGAAETAKAALESLGWVIAGDSRQQISNGNVRLNLALFKLDDQRLSKLNLQNKSSSPKLTEIVAASPDATVSVGRQDHIITASPQWAYAAYFPLNLNRESGEIVVKLSVKVLKGAIGFGILTGDEKAFYTRTTIEADNDLRTVLLETAHPENSRKLIIENDTPGGNKAEVEIFDIQVLAPAAAEENGSERRESQRATHAASH